MLTTALLRPRSSIVLGLSIGAPLFAQQPRAPEPPYVAEASDEAGQSLARFTVAEGFRVDLWAAEPMLANPVAIALDALGRCYVAETFRLHAGVTDIREHMDWLDDDLASRTVEDRVAMIRRHAGADFASYETAEDRVRRIEDSDGDGRAESATVFAGGFDGAAAGIGAGLLADGESVFYACIPELWRLADGNGDGIAEERETLSAGYGVNVALLGHDLHGLQMGPDGRLYFSIGDRGLHVQTKEGALLDYPKTGCVLRCDPDGANLEVYASGLRNPQELVFDERGNLFTGDNNSDGGDRARFVWVLEGGDSGWRYPYQWITEPDLRGPWNAEGIWRPAHAGQPAYVVPPVANFADGPSGLTYVPGPAWGEAWRDTFLLCDFRGTASLSGVHAFRVAPSGAGFELVEPRRFFWGCLATDADFGPDGALYVSDWVDGWKTTGKGRIWRIAPAAGIAAEDGSEIGRLLSGALIGRDAFELRPYLAHADRRVRLAAQFELVRQARVKTEGDRETVIGHLRDAARIGESLVERLHGIWGMGQLARSDKRMPAMLFPLLADPEPEVRAQALRVLGEARHGFSSVKPFLDDPEPRVRMFAAQALGHYGTLHAVEPLIELVRRNADADPWIRHACVHALERLRQRAALLAYAADPSPAVRRAVILVLRRWKDPEIARFLADEDRALVAEAARAIHDVPIDEARDALAAALDVAVAGDDEYFRRRMLAANSRRGEAGARTIAGFVARRQAPERVLAEGLELLSAWDRPAPHDPVTGDWRPFARERSLADVGLLVAELGPAAMASGSERVLVAWLRLAARSGASDQAGNARTLFDEARVGSQARIAALECLLALRPGEAHELLRKACRGVDAALREAAFARLPALPAEEALELLDEGMAQGSLDVRRAALGALAAIAAPETDARLLAALAALEQGSWPAELELDLLESAERRDSPAVRASFERVRSAREAGTPLGALAPCTRGGDASRGRRVFFEDQAVTCLRCHRVGEEGGTETGGLAGPDLTQVGARLSREALLESVVHPNALLAEGFERWVLVLDDDSAVAGTILGEDANEVRLLTPGEEELVIERARVVERRRDLSSMPDGLGEKISRRALRDLVEYLASLR